MTKHDIYASYHGMSAQDVSRIGGDQDLDVYTRLQLLALTLPDSALKEVGRGIYRSLVHEPTKRESTFDQAIKAKYKPQIEELGTVSPPLDPEHLRLLPDCTFALQFTLTLLKPYLSKDDEALYIIDNPVAKDHVFRVPMVRASSWKGVLRSAAREVLETDDQDPRIERLFGNEKEHEPLRQGRLVFYTTFFDRMDLEIINPHNRERKVGINPIPIESVPAGATGLYSLLYAPLDLVASKPNENQASFHERRTTEVFQDMTATFDALHALVCQLGFSAKRTSGYGVARQSHLDGVIRIKWRKKVVRAGFDSFVQLTKHPAAARKLWQKGAQK